MQHPRVDGLDRGRQSGTAVGDDQQQLLALQSAPVQIFQQSFPGGLALASAAQKGQQMAGAVLAHPVGHQHLHPLAPRRPPHAQAHPVQKQIRPLVGQRRLMKLRDRLVQIAGRCAIRSADSPPRRSAWPPPGPPAGSRSRAETPRGSAARHLRRAAETWPPPRAGNPACECARCAAAGCRSGSRNLWS